MRRRLLILTTVLFLIAGAAYLYVASGRLHQRVRLALRAAAVRLACDLVSVHDDRRTPITVRGKYLLDRATLDVDLAAAGAPLQQWGPYLVRTEGLVFEDGTADADVHVLSAPWGARRALDFQGTVRLAGGAATLLPQRAHLRDVRGLLRVDNLRLQTDDLRLSVDGSPLRVRGEMTLQFGRLLDLAVTSPQLDLATVQRLLFPGSGIRLEGTTGADIRVSGPWSALAVDGTISHARGMINQQPLNVESSGLTLVGDLLIFDDFRAAAEGARMRGDLRLTLGRGGTLLAVAGENVLPEMLRRGGLALQLPGGGRRHGNGGPPRPPGGAPG